jgi:hypothetical protein
MTGGKHFFSAVRSTSSRLVTFKHDAADRTTTGMERDHGGSTGTREEDGPIESPE